MEELFTLFLVLFLLLGGVAIVGHGIWVVVAWMVGGLGQKPSFHASSVRNASCPRCRSPLQPEQLTCEVCDWPEKFTGEVRQAEVQAVLERQLKHYRGIGAISAETYAEWLASLGLDSSIAEEPAIIEAPVPPVPGPPLPQPSPIDAWEVLREDRLPPEEEAKAGQVRVPVPAIETDRKPPTPAERVRKYAADREAAGAHTPAGAGSSAADQRREALGKLLASFLDEKNIRWGELAGGLLIVCCSAALVISFWAEIAARPLLKFCVFNGVSAALFGVGLYTNRRWKIHTTSQGILIIAILLVPLNFLAIAAFTDRSPPTDLLSLAGETLSLALFATFTFYAARILTPRVPLLVVIGVMFPSLMQLLTRRFVDGSTATWLLYVLAAVPLGSYLTSAGLPLWRARKEELLDESVANRLLVLMGIVSYAAFFPLALLLYKSGTILTTVERLSPLLVLCGVPSLALGLLFWRRLVARELAALQTAGLAIGTLGVLIMLAAVGLAWPNPALLLPTALVTAAVFVILAAQFRVPKRIWWPACAECWPG